MSTWSWGTRYPDSFFEELTLRQDVRHEAAWVAHVVFLLDDLPIFAGLKFEHTRMHGLVGWFRFYLGTPALLLRLNTSEPLYLGHDGRVFSRFTWFGLRYYKPAFLGDNSATELREILHALGQLPTLTDSVAQ